MTAGAGSLCLYTDGEGTLEENKEQQAKSTGIDLYSIVRDVLREWWTIGLLAVSVYLMVNMWTEMSYKPEYTTTAVFSVTARGMNQTLYEQLSSAQSVAARFKTVLESDIFDRKMEEILGEKVEGTKTVRQIESTNLVMMSVTASSAMDSYRLMRAITDNYRELSDYVIKDVSVDFLRRPAVPLGASNPPGGNGNAKRAAAAAALLLAAYYAFFSYMKDTVKNRREARSKLLAQPLGTVCHEAKRFWRIGKHNVKGRLITNPIMSFRFVETTRMTASRIENRMHRRGVKVLIVSSVAENEGKSTIASNLAISLAQSGKRTLIIDGDFRKPSLMKLFEIPEEEVTDLTETLRGNEIPDDLIKPAWVNNLFLISNNHATSDVDTIVRSGGLGRIIGFCRNRFDYIILDMPPIGVAPEVEMFAEYADASLIVVREDMVLTRDINSVITALNNTNAPVLGTVLNDDRSGQASGSYGYGYGYSRQYGGYYGKSKA